MTFCPYCMSAVPEDYRFCAVCGKQRYHNVPAHQLLPGTMLQQRYLIGASLGEGGCGITYIGRDLNLDMLVAVKEFFPNGFVTRNNNVAPSVDMPTTADRKDFFEKGCEKFLQEARTLAKFSTEPGIVNVRDFFEQNNTAYIVMEYLNGETLKAHIDKNGKLSIEETLNLLLPVMSSLKKVHDDGLIHRDISPDNIMIMPEGAKLLDFGAARDISAMGNKSLSIMLKPGYAPEEQYRTHGEQGPWTDVYALCATVYKCITGITPDDSIDRNFDDTLKPPSELGIDIHPITEAALMCGLAIDHRERYQSIDEILDGFKGILRDPGSAETLVLPKNNARGSQRNVVIPHEYIPTGTASAASLLKRAFLFLEDCDWKTADEYCEKVLDIDPECAEAYLGKLMASLQVSKRGQLDDCKEPFESNPYYQKVLRFADDELANEIKGCNEYIKERNENARLTELYNLAVKAMSSARAETAFNAAAIRFKELGDFSDSKKLHDICREKAEIAKKETIYLYAEKNRTEDTLSSLRKALEQFESISDWKDAKEKAELCKKRIQERETQAEELRIKLEREEKRTNRIKNILLLSIAGIIAILILTFNVIIPSAKYSEAESLMEEGRNKQGQTLFEEAKNKYKKAQAIFEELDDYSDSRLKVAECKQLTLEATYSNAIALMDQDKYEEAIIIFESIAPYEHSALYIDSCKSKIQIRDYNQAVDYMSKGEYSQAADLFKTLGDYKDSKALYKECASIWSMSDCSDIAVGDTITFGLYEQDGNTANNQEPIEWQVLEVANGKALVICNYVLNNKPYNDVQEITSWENCSLRKWLNEDFYNEAFSSANKAKILESSLPLATNSESDVYPDNAIKDSLFLLSIVEANKYFSTDSQRRCEATNYASANGTYCDAIDGTCNWWLRSHGKHQSFASNVLPEGSIKTYGDRVDSEHIGVRPAMWIDISD